MATEDKMYHSTDQAYGENLYASLGVIVTGSLPVKAWYDEINSYDFKASTFSVDTGHFTQIVWKNTMLLGVGIAKSISGRTYVAANYAPPGNFLGEFMKNVLPLKNL